MSTTVTYKGNVIANVSNNTKTLTTQGKYLEGNIVLTDVSGGGSSMQAKTATYTPSGAQQTDTITPDTGYDGLSSVGVTVNAIAPPWYDMSGEWSFLGKGAEIVKTDFYSKIDVLKNTDWHGWTPSSTAKVCVASVNCNTFVATDVADYDYYIVWECGVDPVYTGTPTHKALPQLSRAWFVQGIEKRPSSFANIQAENFNNTVSVNIYNSSFMRYYGTTTNTSTMTWGASYGLYFAATAAGISSTTAASPTITPKTPTLSGRTSTTYMSTTNAGLIDEENTKWWIKGKYVIRCPKTSFYQGIYKKVVELINSPSPTA